MLDYIYHMKLKIIKNRIFGVKSQYFVLLYNLQINVFWLAQMPIHCR